jgi:farnesyl-diphosphate farnesyltransferase
VRNSAQADEIYQDQILPRVSRSFALTLSELVGVAHAHLRNALTYTLLIPSNEVGIRRFCLWAIGLAVLTLRNIERTPGFNRGEQVKVSHSAVAATRMLTSFAVRHDGLLIRLFDAAARNLPLASLPSLHEAPSAALETRAAGGWN